MLYVGATGCSWEQFPGNLGGNFGELGEDWEEIGEDGSVDEINFLFIFKFNIDHTK